MKEKMKLIKNTSDWGLFIPGKVRYDFRRKHKYVEDFHYIIEPNDEKYFFCPSKWPLKQNISIFRLMLTQMLNALLCKQSVEWEFSDFDVAWVLDTQ